jgi:hypothetical protein
MYKTIRVEMSNNSDARRLSGARRFAGVPASCRHNGGKIVVMTVSADSLAALESALDASHSVRGYAVEA